MIVITWHRLGVGRQLPITLITFLTPYKRYLNLSLPKISPVTVYRYPMVTNGNTIMIDYASSVTVKLYWLLDSELFLTIIGHNSLSTLWTNICFS